MKDLVRGCGGMTESGVNVMIRLRMFSWKNSRHMR